MFKFFKKENIFTDIERTKLLKMCKPLLVTKYNSPTMKGLTSRADLKKITEFNFYINKIKTIIEKHYKQKFNVFQAWCRYTQGDHLNFHSHFCIDLTVGYFLKNPSGLGTLVRTHGEEINFGGEENSLAAFDASLSHSVPDSSDKIERYTFIVDLKRKKNGK